VSCFAQCGVQTAVDSKLSSPVVGTVAAVGSGVPFMIVSAGSFIHLSTSTLPVINIPQSTIINQLCDAVTVQPYKDLSASVLQSTALSTCSAVVAESSGLVQRTLSGTSSVLSGAKLVPRLSRLNAIDLSVTTAADSDVTVPPVTVVSLAAVQTAPQTVNITSSAADNESSESGDAERIVQRREIAPIPGAVCSAEEAARVGSSYLCSFCGKTFSSAPQLAVHRNIHYFERLKCTVCRSSFPSRAALEHHRSKEHDVGAESVTAADPRPFKCDQCGVAFRIQGHLAKHKRSKVHAARLENSQDLPGTGDMEECTSGLPLTVDERDAEETECDEYQREVNGEQMDSDAVCEPQQPDNGEIFYLSVCCTYKPLSLLLILCNMFRASD